MKTLNDLIERFQLYAICTDCERMERVSIQHLVEHYGGDFLIEAVRQRLRCTSCRVRTGDIRIVYVGEKGKVAGFHYRGTGRSRSSDADNRPPLKPVSP
jgi:hypothetical protein